MNYKVEGAIRRNRKYFIVYAILWIVIAIAFVSPFSYSAHVAGLDGEFKLDVFIETFGTSITNPIGTLGNLFLCDIYVILISINKELCDGTIFRRNSFKSF